MILALWHGAGSNKQNSLVKNRKKNRLILYSSFLLYFSAQSAHSPIQKSFFQLFFCLRYTLMDILESNLGFSIWRSQGLNHRLVDDYASTTSWATLWVHSGRKGRDSQQQYSNRLWHLNNAYLVLRGPHTITPPTQGWTTDKREDVSSTFIMFSAKLWPNHPHSAAELATLFYCLFFFVFLFPPHFKCWHLSAKILLFSSLLS